MADVGLEVKGLKEAQRALRDLKLALSQGRVAPMKLVTVKAVKIIRDRTLKGQDVNHNPFTPYSKAYAKKKKGRPNLKVSEDMLGAVSSQAWAKKGRVYIKRGLQWVKGIVHNNAGRSGRGTGFKMTKREFMGVDKEADSLRVIYRNWWYALVKKLGL
jgi:hypothetical protein